MEDCKTELINDGFLLVVLRGVEESGVELLGWKCGPAVPPGANYLSRIFRVSAEYRVAKNERRLSIIVKVPLEDDAPDKEQVDSFHGAQREFKMYDEVFPRMFQLHPWRGVPRGFHSPVSDVIVLEDLRELGYRMYPRGVKLDYQHCKEILMNLSKFHAVSVKLHQDFPELIESVGKDPRFADDSARSQYWREELGKFASLAESAEFATKIRRNVENFYPAMMEIFKPSKVLNVLTHYDLWVNNMMFRYDDSGALLDSKLVDFQSPRYCSFAADLIEMWWFSVDVEVRERHREELFEVYRHNLNKSLEEVNCPQRVTKVEFDSELKRFCPYSLKPVLDYVGGEQFRRQLPTLLKQMDEFGVFS